MAETRASSYRGLAPLPSFNRHIRTHYLNMPRSAFGIGHTCGILVRVANLFSQQCVCDQDYASIRNGKYGIVMYRRMLGGHNIALIEHDVSTQAADFDHMVPGRVVDTFQIQYSTYFVKNIGGNRVLIGHKVYDDDNDNLHVCIILEYSTGKFRIVSTHMPSKFLYYDAIPLDNGMTWMRPPFACRLYDFRVSFDNYTKVEDESEYQLHVHSSQFAPAYINEGELRDAYALIQQKNEKLMA